MERPGNLVADVTLDWLSKNYSKKFFLWMHLYDPHYPYRPPAPQCSDAGGVLFEIDHKVEAGLEDIALATSELDANRYPNLWDLDLRLAKTITLQRAKIVLSGDLFNALNSNTETSRARILGASAFGTLNEVISPRILRIAAKLQF